MLHNNSLATARCTEERERLAEELRQSWIAPAASMLHWHGKTLKLKRRQKSYFLAIYLSEVKNGEPSHLLSIPTAPGWTGKEEFGIVKKTLESRKACKKQVVGFGFDKTLTNTGEWEKVCSLLANYIIGLPVLWCNTSLV